MGFMSIRRIYPVFRSSLIDRSCFLFSRFHLRYLCHPRESKDRAASTYTSCKSKSRRLFYWREHTAHMFMNIRVYTVMYICSCECVWLPRKVCNLSVQWLDIEQMSLATDLGIRALVSYLPGVIPALTRAPQVLSHGCVVWHFVCLVFLLCFLPCLGWPRLKNYTISLFDFFAKNSSPTLFCIFWFL